MKYDIYLSDYERKTVLQLPIVPSELPSLLRNNNNEQFETFSNGTYNIIGDIGLLEFSLESWLPGKGKNYSFQRVKNINPDDYINLFNTAMLYKKPIRVIIVRSDGTFLINHIFSIDSFEFKEDKNSDYVYSTSLREWREY